MAVNPICTVLEKNLETGLKTLDNAYKFQAMIQQQVKNIQELADLSSLLDAIPNENLILDTTQLNAILESCPGAFGSVDEINLAMFEGLKDYLGFLKTDPLGKLSGLADSLTSYMEPIKDISDQLRNYAVCLRNICAYTDFDVAWRQISNAERLLNLDADGTPQILDSTVQNLKTQYESRVATLTNAMDVYKTFS